VYNRTRDTNRTKLICTQNDFNIQFVLGQFERKLIQKSLTNSLQSRSFLSRTFLVKKMIPYKTYVQEDHLFLAWYGSTTIQSRLFLKKYQNFVGFLKQYLLSFFNLEKQFANIPDRGFLFIRNTLLLYPLRPYRQTDRQTVKYTRIAWAGGTFFHFQLCFCVSFFFWREIEFFPAKSEPGYLRFGGNWFHIIFRWIVLEAAQIWWEKNPHYFLADCFGGCSDGLFLDRFLLDFRGLFGVRFR
jgi:hypothetical protein